MDSHRRPHVSSSRCVRHLPPSLPPSCPHSHSHSRARSRSRPFSALHHVPSAHPPAVCVCVCVCDGRRLPGAPSLARCSAAQAAQAARATRPLLRRLSRARLRLLIRPRLASAVLKQIFRGKAWLGMAWEGMAWLPSHRTVRYCMVCVGAIGLRMRSMCGDRPCQNFTGRARAGPLVIIISQLRL